MTPEERSLVTDLFGRLATVENSPRDPDADRAIRDGLRQAPNALYALVQTTLMQDAALKHADERIQALEAQVASAAPQSSGSFLGGGRDSVWARPAASRAGSVPSVSAPNVRTPDPVASPWGQRGAAPAAPQGSAPSRPPGPGYAPPPQPGYPPPQQPGYAPAMPPPAARSGGSFLGTAAAAVAGAVGGALLMNSMSSMMGGSAHAAPAPGQTPGGTTPAGNSESGGTLARDAGVNDIGRPPSGRGDSSSDDQGFAGSDSGNAQHGGDTQSDDGTQYNDDTQNAAQPEQYETQETPYATDFQDDDGFGSDSGGGDGGGGGGGDE